MNQSAAAMISATTDTSRHESERGHDCIHRHRATHNNFGHISTTRRRSAGGISAASGTVAASVTTGGNASTVSVGVGSTHAELQRPIPRASGRGEPPGEVGRRETPMLAVPQRGFVLTTSRVTPLEPLHSHPISTGPSRCRSPCAVDGRGWG